MTEQERPKETPIQFPKVAKEDLEPILVETINLSGDGIKDFLSLIREEEPLLTRLINSLAEISPDPEHLAFGAAYAFGIFSKLAKKGYPFPEVSSNVIQTFETELATQSAEFLQQLENSTDPREAFKRTIKSSEFNFPVPDDYRQENPQLMDAFDSTSLPLHASVGAIIIYELKRRQFHADQLAKQFGG